MIPALYLVAAALGLLLSFLTALLARWKGYSFVVFLLFSVVFLPFALPYSISLSNKRIQAGEPRGSGVVSATLYAGQQCAGHQCRNASYLQLRSRIFLRCVRLRSLAAGSVF